MNFVKSGEAPPDMTSTTSTTQSTMTSTLSLEQRISQIFGDEVLQLEEIQIKAFTDEEVRLLRKNHPLARTARAEYRAEVLQARTEEVNNYQQIELIVAEAKKKNKAQASLKLSISVSKAKAGALTYIYNGKGAKARECFDRMKLKYGIMMEQTLEGSVGNLMIMDVEHPNQRTSRDYLGDKETENARRLGENIMNTINYIENMIRVLC